MCPWDGTHYFREEDRQAHLAVCPSRALFEMPPARDPPPSQPFKQEEECWDPLPGDEVTYNPQTYAMNALVLRRLPMPMTKSEKREFYAAERDR